MVKNRKLAAYILKMKNYYDICEPGGLVIDVPSFADVYLR